MLAEIDGRCFDQVYFDILVCHIYQKRFKNSKCAVSGPVSIGTKDENPFGSCVISDYLIYIFFGIRSRLCHKT